MKLIRGLTSLTLLLVLVVAVPSALVFFGGNPFPSDLPTWADITRAVTRPDDGSVLLAVLTIAGWIGWASFAFTVAIELAAQARHLSAPRLPAGLSIPQAGARALVAAVLAMLTLAGPAINTAAAGQIEVTPGDTLSHIAATELGDSARYPEIAAANPTLINDVDLIQPGWTLQIPDDTATEQDSTSPRETATREVDVNEGDTLWDLAEKHLGDGHRYPEIAATNPELIKDVDLIEPGWTLAMPTTTKDHVDTQTDTTDPDEKPAEDTAPNGAAPTETDAAAPPETNADAPAESKSPARPELAPAPEATPETVTDTTSPLTAQITDDQASPIAWGTIGISGLSAAGVIGLLAAARQAQSRRRQPGKRMAMPTGAAATTERALRTEQDPLAASDLDRALRALASHAHHSTTPMPAIRAARITTHELELYLVDDTTMLPEPFAATEDPATWILHREHLTHLAEATDLQDTPAPCPALVTLGLDDTGGWILVNLEQIGSLAIEGQPEDSTAALAALALELVGSTWADDLRVTLVGVMPELADALASDRVEYVPTLDRVLAGVMHASDVHARTLTGSGHDSVTTARGAMVATETWTPHLLLMGEPATETQREQLQEVIARIPRLAVATITTTSAPLTDWVLHVQAGQAGTLDPAGVTLEPQMIHTTDYNGLIDAFRTTQADDVDGPAWANTLVSEPTIDELGDFTPGPDPEPLPTTPPEAISDVPSDITLSLAPTAQPSSADEADDEEPAQPTVPNENSTEDLGDTKDAHPVDPTLDVSTPDLPDETTDAGSGTVKELSPAGPWLRLFGAPEVRGATGKRPQAHGKATELLVFLALHPADTHEPLDRALWPSKRMDASRRNSPVSQARSWLGHKPDGRPHVGHVNDIGYRLEDVTTDWDDFTALIGDNIETTTTTDLEEALRLVDEPPFPRISARYYTWAEVDQREMIAAIADVAHELSTRALSMGDARTAGWAAAKGLMVEEASELLWRDQLRAAWLSGTPNQITHTAERMTDTLETIGGDMEPETIELLEQLLTNRQPRRSHA